MKRKMAETRSMVLTGTILLAAFIMLQCTQKNEESMNTSAKQDVLSVIHARKSVRSFIPGKTVSKEDIETIAKAGMAAPTGRDTRPWEIIVIDDRHILDAMAEGLPYAKMLAQAPQAIVVCGDSTKSSYWYVDCSAATENMLLAIEALGLGAVWTAAYPYQERMDVVTQNLGLPENILPLCVLPLGYPDGENSPKNKFDEKKIHFNKW